MGKSIRLDKFDPEVRDRHNSKIGLVQIHETAHRPPAMMECSCYAIPAKEWALAWPGGQLSVSHKLSEPHPQSNRPQNPRCPAIESGNTRAKAREVIAGVLQAIFRLQLLPSRHVSRHLRKSHLGSPTPFCGRRSCRVFLIYALFAPQHLDLLSSTLMHGGSQHFRREI
jgi:hypothetical protein